MDKIVKLKTKRLSRTLMQYSSNVIRHEQIKNRYSDYSDYYTYVILEEIYNERIKPLRHITYTILDPQHSECVGIGEVTASKDIHKVCREGV